MKLIIITILIATLSACSNMGNMNKVSIGMSKSQVIDILGDPDSSSATEQKETLVYNYWKEFWDRKPSEYSDRYFVTLRDNKVVSYGKAGDSVDNTKKVYVE